MARGKKNELTDDMVREIIAMRGLMTAYQVGRKYGIAATRVAGYWNTVQDGDASADELAPHVSEKLAALGLSKSGRKAAGVRETKSFTVQTGVLKPTQIGKQSYSYSDSASDSDAAGPSQPHEPHQSALSESLDVLLASIDAQGGPDKAAPTDLAQARRIAKRLRSSGEVSAQEYTQLVDSLTNVEPQHAHARRAGTQPRSCVQSAPIAEPIEPPRTRPLGRHRQDRDDGGWSSRGNGGGRIRGGPGGSSSRGRDRLGRGVSPGIGDDRWSAEPAPVAAEQYRGKQDRGPSRTHAHAADADVLMYDDIMAPMTRY
jgi:hypothetical protein